MGSKYLKKFDLLGYDTVVVDVDGEKLSKLPDSFKKYTDLDDALEREDITHLFVATSPNLHVPIAKKGLERGINVMVEKPPSLNPEELEEAIDLAHSKGVVLAVSEIELRSSSVRNLKKPQKVKNLQAYRLNLGKGYINPFYDLAWHDLYIISYLLGGFTIKKVVDRGNLFDIEGETGEGSFTLQVAWNHSFLKREWLMETEEGQVVLDFVEDRIIYGDGTTVEKDGVDKLELMIKQFTASPSFESSYRALNILKEFEKFSG